MIGIGQQWSSPPSRRDNKRQQLRSWKNERCYHGNCNLQPMGYFFIGCCLLLFLYVTRWRLNRFTVKKAFPSGGLFYQKFLRYIATNAPTISAINTSFNHSFIGVLSVIFFILFTKNTGNLFQFFCHGWLKFHLSFFLNFRYLPLNCYCLESETMKN